MALTRDDVETIRNLRKQAEALARGNAAIMVRLNECGHKPLEHAAYRAKIDLDGLSRTIYQLEGTLSLAVAEAEAITCASPNCKVVVKDEGDLCGEHGLAAAEYRSGGCA